MQLTSLPALTDTHCHLDFNAFDEDRPQVIERARQAGLTHLLNPGTDLASSRAAIQLAETYPEVYAAAGVHPNDAQDYGPGTRDALRALVLLPDSRLHPKVAAIGEIGLDYYRDRTPHEQQRRVFNEQLLLAAELELPVVIHNRQADVDILPMVMEWQAGLQASGSPLASRPGVLHSYSGDVETARKAVEINFLIGITGPVTFKNARDLPSVVAEVPLTSLLVETDAPFLAPHPHRGQRNEPSYVRLVVEKIASILNQPVSAVAEVTTTNARRLFNW